MDAYDQLWSLVEANEADIVPDLVDTLIRGSAADGPLSTDVPVDLSALESAPDAAPYAADFLTGSAGGDDFFPIHAFAAAPPTIDRLPGLDLSLGEPLVLPAAANDVVDVVEPLVLPGVMDDKFLMGDYDDGRLVLPGGDPDLLTDDGERFLGRYAHDSVGFDLPVDHTVHADDHGLIGAHASDDWLF